MKLTSAAAAAIIAVGLVTTPHPPGSTDTHHTPVPHSRVIAVNLTTAAIPIDTKDPTLSRVAAATPQANATGPTPENVARAALAAVLAAGWYAATPITLPAAVVGMFIVFTVIASVTGVPLSVGVGAIEFGVRVWAQAPLSILQTALNDLKPAPNSAAAVRPSRRLASLPTTSPAPRQGQQTTSGLAGSRRTADHTPRMHRSPKATSAKKSSGTAGSGRAQK